MRRILVPLDGTALAASIIPDARRLAGPGGKLVLIRDAGSSTYEHPNGPGVGLQSLQEAEGYLENLALSLGEDGVDVEIHVLALLDPAYAIDLAVEIYLADMVACATHGRSPLGRLLRGGVAWRALARSTVPVLLHRIDQHPRYKSIFAQPRKIMVPLDGSEHAEAAISLAAQLAEEWNAQLVIVQAVPALQPTVTPFSLYEVPPTQTKSDLNRSSAYLSGIAARMDGPVATRVRAGSVVEELITCAKREDVTDIVMASHGRTGLSRVILGSVADELVHRLTLPIIVVPSLAAPQLQTHGREAALHAQPALSDR